MIYNPLLEYRVFVLDIFGSKKKGEKREKEKENKKGWLEDRAKFRNPRHVIRYLRAFLASEREEGR